jgi:rhodanese-related sulfurtransferase
MQTQQELNGQERVRTVDPELLLQEIRSGRKVTILDVRRSAAFRGPSGRIPGAISLPLYQLSARWEEFTCHKGDPIVVASARGIKSRLAALELELAGFTEVRSLEGGLHRWRELGFPVTYATTPPP